MNWRTDKPTAKLIVAEIGFGKSAEYYDVLSRLGSGAYIGKNGVEPFSHILRWADLEEDETVTDCNELEEEIQRELEKLGGGYGGWNDGFRDEDLKDFARYFAKWGAEHLKTK